VSHHILHWTSVALTDTGCTRKINEDAYLDFPDHGLWVVADGMGGHSAGDFASQSIVETLRDTAPGDSISHLANEVKQHLNQVNVKLCEESEKRGDGIIGSTVVAFLAHPSDQGQCIYIWAGDSRIYLYRRGSLRQLSRDHSQVEELIEQGVLKNEEDAANYAISNYITRAIGADYDLELDAEMIEPQDGDVFVLCSDGLNKEIKDEEIKQHLDQYSLQDATERLIKLCLDRGARDNVTLITVGATTAAS